MSRVSIIVPCHNAAPWLRATLESALAQTWPQKEIIVVDDGSTDESLTIARDFASRGVRVVSQPNLGASSARNHGLRIAQGDLVQFLDADDLLAPDKIARQVETLAAAPPGTVASGPWGSFRRDPVEARPLPASIWADLAPVDWLVTSWSGGGTFPPIVWLSPRRVLEAAGPWDESLSLDDDGEYFCRVLLASAGVRFVAGAMSYYRRHDGPRLSTSRGERAARSSFASCTRKEEHLFAVDQSPAARRAVGSNWQRFAWEQCDAAPPLAAKALARSRELAPDLPPPDGTRPYRLAARLLGWTRARRLQLAALRLLGR